MAWMDLAKAPGCVSCMHSQILSVLSWGYLMFFNTLGRLSELSCLIKRPFLKTSRQFYPKTEKSELSFVLFTRSSNQSLTNSFIPSFHETLLKLENLMSQEIGYACVSKIEQHLALHFDALKQ
jgi:hypothetical protein